MLSHRIMSFFDACRMYWYVLAGWLNADVIYSEYRVDGTIVSIEIHPRSYYPM